MLVLLYCLVEIPFRVAFESDVEGKGAPLSLHVGVHHVVCLIGLLCLRGQPALRVTLSTWLLTRSSCVSTYPGRPSTPSIAWNGTWFICPRVCLLSLLVSLFTSRVYLNFRTAVKVDGKLVFDVAVIRRHYLRVCIACVVAWT